MKDRTSTADSTDSQLQHAYWRQRWEQSCAMYDCANWVEWQPDGSTTTYYQAGGDPEATIVVSNGAKLLNSGISGAHIEADERKLAFEAGEMRLYDYQVPAVDMLEKARFNAQLPLTGGHATPLFDATAAARVSETLQRNEKLLRSITDTSLLKEMAKCYSLDAGKVTIDAPGGPAELTMENGYISVGPVISQILSAGLRPGDITHLKPSQHKSGLAALAVLGSQAPVLRVNLETPDIQTQPQPRWLPHICAEQPVYTDERIYVRHNKQQDWAIDWTWQGKPAWVPFSRLPRVQLQLILEHLKNREHFPESAQACAQRLLDKPQAPAKTMGLGHIGRAKG